MKKREGEDGVGGKTQTEKAGYFIHDGYDKERHGGVLRKPEDVYAEFGFTGGGRDTV